MRNYSWINKCMFRLFIVAALLGAGFTNTQIAIAQSEDASVGVVGRMNDDSSAYSTFITQLNSADTAEKLKSVKVSADTLSIKFSNDSTYYRDLSTKSTVAAYTAIYTRLADTTLNVSISLNDISTSITNLSEANFSAAIDRMNAFISTYDIVVGDYNSLIGASSVDYKPILISIFAISAVVSLVLLIQSFVGNKLLEAEEIRNKYQFSLFKYSLWPFFGSLITLVWFLMTPPGGKFYVLWGPILFGWVAFAAQGFTYLKDTRPMIQKMRKEEIASIRASSIKNRTS